MAPEFTDRTAPDSIASGLSQRPGPLRGGRGPPSVMHFARVAPRHPSYVGGVTVKRHDPVEAILKTKGAEVHSITSEATVYEALVMMASKRIGALIVMDGSELVGIFSERDYARKVILVGRSSKEMKVSEIMSSPVITVHPQSTVDECMQHMTGRRCRHLPVTDEGKIIGLVSLGDLVNWIISHQERTIHDLEDYISGDYPG